ncbi:latent-transforming growth factor beta-binding protein 4 isoform X2 [Ambystoma mexicanum]|uniref:latent-transforming growth factor beta-binding protein 4 isoform X2 n=1 Tax=Ambystoma mexicanum TaxID=8296 RepID=UPI0037E83860
MMGTMHGAPSLMLALGVLLVLAQSAQGGVGKKTPASLSPLGPTGRPQVGAAGDLSIRVRAESKTGDKGKKTKQSKKAKVQKVASPNQCGEQCCPGWIVAPKTGKCTKAICTPKCKNKGLCKKPQFCICKPGFAGLRCEFREAALLQDPGSSSYVPILDMSPLPVPPSARPALATISNSLNVNPLQLPSSTDSPVHCRHCTENAPGYTVSAHPDRPATGPAQDVDYVTGRPRPYGHDAVGSDQKQSSNSNKSLDINKKPASVRWQPLTLQELQSVLQRKSAGPMDKMTLVLAKHLEAQKSKLSLASLKEKDRSTKSVRTPRGEFTIEKDNSPPAANQSQGERVRVHFTPMICKVHCLGDRCTNHCERGNKTTVYSGEGTHAGGGAGFRVFLCPMVCKNGGVCLKKDQCLCPPNFTGKFCHIPVLPSDGSRAGRASVLESSDTDPKHPMTKTVYTLPLSNHQPEHTGAASIVKVHVQHPPEASVKIHQVERMEGRGGEQANPHREVSRNSLTAGRRSLYSVQAQSSSNNNGYTESSGFGYCFRQLNNGQCASPLPGLRTQEICCRGSGIAWGVHDCLPCAGYQGNTAVGRTELQCPKGYEQINGSCVDIDECLEPGLCQNGDCTNTRGSYSCLCKTGFLLDSSRSSCISQHVISEAKGPCYRILRDGGCSLPILRNITKQICCCSRVGKAWGKSCERCPAHGSDDFKEICPAGPGYHYSAADLRFNTRFLGQDPPRIPIHHQVGPRPTTSATAPPYVLEDRRPGRPVEIDETRPIEERTPLITVVTEEKRPAVPEERRPLRPVVPEETKPVRPAAPDERRPAVRPAVPEERRPVRPAAPEERRPVRPAVPEDIRPLVPAVLPPTAFSPALIPAPEPNVCELNPQICGPGRCVPRQGSYTCVCNNGFWLSTQGTHCIDVDECRQSPRPCIHGRCENTVGSYRCACAPGFRANAQGTECSDIDECAVSQPPCANGRCENTAGSFRCLCSAGFVLNPQGTSCIDVDECRQPSRRSCLNGRCENTVGSFLCVCSAGFKSNPQGTECHDIDECRQSPRPCGSGRCENTAGSFRCVCPAGFRLNLQEAECVDINECENPGTCAGQECLNTAGSFQCRPCRPGYRLQNRRCIDVNECQAEAACGSGGRCINTEGSFQCECQVGYQLSSDGKKCADINECLESEYCFPHGECLNTEGSYSCLCAEGFTTTADETTCIDKDECRQGGVCSGGRCSNTEGSFECACPTGYRPNEDKAACVDVDECLEPTLSRCGTQRCENTAGSFKCVSRCDAGYRATASGGCVDINECTNSTLCGGHAVCQNLVGSYRCVCNWGYEMASDGQRCVDVDECVEYGVSLCGLRGCENTAGSYKCVTNCDPGYQLTPAGECTDINECQNRTTCGEHAMCQNLVGSFQCLCDQGYEGARDGRQCVDVNECQTLQGVCGMAQCENVEGSFLCICPNSNEEFDPMTGKCIRPRSAARPMLPSGPSPPRAGHDVVPVGGLKECYYNLDDVKVCENILARNLSSEECCCTVGEGWGSDCKIQKCPRFDTDAYRSLCPSGAGYISGSQGYKDADECSLFGTQVCKGGVCVNKVPGYSCYCSNGYYYDVHRLECIDNDECLDEEVCVGGHCVNTVGSYYCTCEPPLILDGSQRRCVTNTSHTQDDSLAYCWREVGPDLVCTRPLLDRQTTYTECCCLYGEAWGMNCALCPSRDSDDFEALCNYLRPPAYGPSGPLPGNTYDYGPEYGPPYNVPYGPDGYSDSSPQRPRDAVRPGYDSYPLSLGGDGGVITGYGPRSPTAYGRRDSLYSRPSYESPDFESDLPYVEPNEEDARVPYRRTDSAYGSRSQAAGTRYQAPSAVDFGSEETRSSQPWRYRTRDTSSFSEFPDRPRSLSETYEGRYEQFEGLQAEECGILNGCENGRCIRVPEGYTCDCYDGYRLDMTRMACVDINECDEAEDLSALCINGQCRNTDGSYECICPRGYVMSRNRNLCIQSRP